jgi:hypothetical protein
MRKITKQQMQYLEQQRKIADFVQSIYDSPKSNHDLKALIRKSVRKQMRRRRTKQ